MILLQDAAQTAADNGFELFSKLGTKFFIRLGIDFVTTFILIRLIYFPIYRKQEYLFTFFIFNLVLFLITYLMSKVEMSLGAAFGLFAVFGMMRYRTEDISVKDMTYLFLAIAIGIVTAVTKGGPDEVGLIAAIILVFVYLLESSLLMRKEQYKNVMYENIEMIKPEHHARLVEDLKKRTGLNITRIAIGKVDFLRDTAIIRVYYHEDKNSGTSDNSPGLSGTASSD